MAQTPQEQDEDELIRDFLRHLDVCTTEQERIDKVKALVSGVVQGVIRQMERQSEQP